MKVLLLNGSPNRTRLHLHRALRGRPRARGERRRNGNAVDRQPGGSRLHRLRRLRQKRQTPLRLRAMIWSTPRWIGCRPATVWWSARRFITRPRAAASPLFWIACSTPAAASFAPRSARRFAARAARARPSTLDQLSKYFTICGMPIAPSQYWPMVHGNTPEDVLKDEEGLQIMRMLGRNMAYMIRAFALARENGLLPPEMEKPKKRTNFIR